MSDDIRNRGKRSVYAVIIVMLILLLAAGALGIGAVKMLQVPVDADSEETVEIEIPVGSTASEIGNILEENGLISSSAGFRIATKLSGKAEYKAGSYALSPSMSVNEIRKILLSGRDATNTSMVVIPEGYTLRDIAETMEKDGICSAEAFLNEAESGQFEYSFLQNAVEGEKRLEGYLFPDSYSFYKGQDPHKVIDTMLARFDEIYGGLQAQYGENPVFAKYNASQIVTVASLIEREACLDKDRAPIAGVIYNRVNKGMKLQFNTTVEYILGEIRELTYEDLKIDSPYNTYMYEGLPAGPISNPGRKSLEAAMNPAETDYLYFVTSDKGDKSMAFSVDYDQFLKDKAAWKASIGAGDSGADTSGTGAADSSDPSGEGTGNGE